MKNTRYNRSNRRRNNSSRHNYRMQRGRNVSKLDPNLFINRPTNTKVLVEKKTHSDLSFEDFEIEAKLKHNISEHGYKTPTPIQEQSIPKIIAGRDIIGIANTGTGKTAAFLISLINKSYKDRNQQVLIVAPTRELALQIGDEFRIFAKGTGLHAVATVGGANIKRQTHMLRQNPNFVIGTPGRLKDLIGRHVLNLSKFNNVVLDEVDRMVDIGFIKDIKRLISLLPEKRQSLFFSATVDNKTREILTNFVTDPVTVSVKQKDNSENIEQDIIRVSGGRTKIDILHDLLIKPGFDKIIVFGRTKWGTEKLARSLDERGFKVAAIHGNKSQNQRQRALGEFKRDKIQILVATDVASRGIDIENVSHVINYDAPTSYDDYIHRIGRTGRAGKQGSAITFVE